MICYLEIFHNQFHKVGKGEIFNRPWLNKHHEDNKLYRKYFELADFEFDEVFDYHHVALIKRFNRFLARNKLTSFSELQSDSG